MSLSRREFLTAALGSSALLSLAPTVPGLWLNASLEAAESKSKTPDSKGDNVLVVVQLSGGNDGLNTVIPYTDDLYSKNRVTLAIGRDQVRKIDGNLGFHPAMKGFSDLLEAGQLSILQGIGYPNPDRSHFESMDIWHTARLEPSRRNDGWLGRCLDATAKNDGRDVPGLHLGSERQPLAVVGQNVRVPSVRSLDGFKLDDGGDSRLRQAIQASASAPRPDAGDLLGFLQRSTVGALASSQQVHEALKKYDTPVAYPGSSLAQQMKTVAQLIDAGLSTRVYYLALDGFDTHSEQGEAHAALLGQLSGAVAAFLQDITHHGHAKRVLVMSFSEFGRRVKENASRGTDHGAAAPLFLAGGRVKPGLIGKHPSLTDLDDGDLKHHTDFRRVYSTILDQWLGCSSESVLGAKYEPLPLLT